MLNGSTSLMAPYQASVRIAFGCLRLNRLMRNALRRLKRGASGDGTAGAEAQAVLPTAPKALH